MRAFNQAKQLLKETQKSWLVTGCAGFIGSNLVEFLLNHNQKVIGLDNFSTGKKHNISPFLLSENFTFIEGDTWDREIAFEACKEIDIVLHQASLGSVPRSINKPLTTNQSNITGFVTLLDASKDAKVEKFVYASSSSVYGDSPTLPKVEHTIGRPLSPYAVTKVTNELYANVFYHTYNLPTIGLRYFNVFGRRQDPKGVYSAVIPKWIGALLDNEEIVINGDGETSRDFTYIDNIIQMNILAGLSKKSDSFGEVFNVAFGGRFNLNELYTIISNSISKYKPNITLAKPSYKAFRLGDIKDSNANINKAKEMFGYEPFYDIHKGMDLTVKWYIDDKYN